MTALAAMALAVVVGLIIKTLSDLERDRLKRRELRRLRQLERGRAQQYADQGITPWERT